MAPSVPTTQTATQSAAREEVTLSWQPPQGMVGLSIYNYLLRIVTFGFHNFWGKTEVRRRVWSAIRLNGEPLTYTGTGKELFKGFMILVAVLLIPLFILGFVSALFLGPGSTLDQLMNLLFILGAVYLVAFGYHRAQRYRLTRTRWRGISGNLEGSAAGYAWTSFWTALLIPLTLGWIGPWRSTKLQGLITNAMRFGDRPFRFSADHKPLYPKFAVFWLMSALFALAVFAIVSVLAGERIMRLIEKVIQIEADAEDAPLPPGLFQEMLIVAAIVYGTMIVGFLIWGAIGAWYRAAQFNHFVAHTEFEGARFRSTVTPAGLIKLAVSNFAIVLFTLGVLAPVALVRMTRYLVDNMELVGEVPLDAILQGEDGGPKHGEGLAQMFDIDGL